MGASVPVHPAPMSMHLMHVKLTKSYHSNCTLFVYLQFLISKTMYNEIQIQHLLDSMPPNRVKQFAPFYFGKASVEDKQPPEIIEPPMTGVYRTVKTSKIK